MPASDDEPNFHAIDRDIKLNEAWHEADRMAREQVESDGLSGPEAEQSIENWRDLYSWDAAPDTSEREIFMAEGIDLPPAEDLNDTELTAKLWEVIHALAARNTFLHHTDHLDDRTLYKQLIEESFHELTKDLPVKKGGWFRGLDMIGSYGDDDMQICLRYYMSDEERAEWAQEWPDDPIPPKEKRPFDRDHLLPKEPNFFTESGEAE